LTENDGKGKILLKYQCVQPLRRFIFDILSSPNEKDYVIDRKMIDIHRISTAEDAYPIRKISLKIINEY